MILVTRPYEDAVLTANVLQEKNLHAHIEPMVTISQRQDGVEAFNHALKENDTLIITSANALKALEEASSQQFDLPVYTVGASTAEKARAMGFKQVHYGGEDATALSATLRITFENRKKKVRLLYPSGYVVSHDMAATLAASGIEVQRVVLYDAHSVECFSEPTLAMFKEGVIDAIMFYSTRSASIFVQLTREAEIEKRLGSIDALVMSQRVAAELSSLSFAAVKVARRPTQTSMIELACSS